MTKDQLEHILESDASDPPLHRTSPWKLTALYSKIQPTVQYSPDTAIGDHLYEIGHADSYYTTTRSVFDAWTGPRMLDGETYHGPIYVVGTSTRYTGPRHCGCSVCETDVPPSLRKN